MEDDVQEKNKILIVDDNPNNLGVLFDFLNNYGFKVFIAVDGKSAIEQVEYVTPDIILLDIMMPEMDGFETCKSLKSNPSTQDIPIIFMTALTETEDKVKGFSLGAVDYITKPIHQEEVLSRVRTHLSMRNLQKKLQEKNQKLQQEIQERQRIQGMLEVERYRLYSLLEELPAYVLLLGQDYSIKFANRYFREKFGDIQQLSCYQAILGNLDPCKRCLPLEVLRTRQSQKWELVGQNNRTYEVYNYPFLDIDGTELILEMGIDITERKDAEEALRSQEYWLNTLINAVPHYIWMKDGEGKWLIANQYSLHLFELLNVNYQGKQDSELLENKTSCKDALITCAATDAEAWQQQTISDSEVVLAHPDNTPQILDLRKIPLFNSDGSRKGLVVVGEDITARKNMELVLQQTHERERLIGLIAQRIRASLNLSDILETTVKEVQKFLQTDRVIICRFHADGRWESIAESLTPGCLSTLEREINNPWMFQKDMIKKGQWQQVYSINDIYNSNLEEGHIRLLEIFNVRAKLVVPIVLTPSELRSHTNENQPKKKQENGSHESPYLPKLAPVLNQVWGFLIAHQCQEPRSWQPLEINLLQQLATQVAIAIKQSQLYQQLEEANQELSRLATVDSLTQLANRRRFDDYLQQEWNRMAREQLPLSLIMCDVDFFKLYNDTYGHQAGDNCLKQVAAIIQQAVQRPADLVARYGGEEFAAILPNTDLCGSLYVARVIQQAIKALKIAHISSSVSNYVTVSLGIATIIPSTKATPEQLIVAADHALYQAKAQGRDQVAVTHV